MLVSYHG